ncbi:MAG: efflux transporter outer membrane subunit [Nitrospiraceae bacterium]|nr:efflux transporter outer membrane subunit [Nitrospiraceae bacterium]
MQISSLTRMILSTSFGIPLLLSACAVGTDYHPPEAPATDRYISRPLSEPTASAPVPGGAAQSFAVDGNVPAAWWTLFHSPDLDELIRQALAASPTLAAAQATLVVAQENVNALVGSALYPAVDAGLSANRRKVSGASFGQPNSHFNPFTLYNASVSVTYGLDLFGGARRELEALRSQVDVQRYQLEGAYLSLTTNMTAAAVREAMLRELISTTGEILALQEKQLEVMERQLTLGAIALPDVLAQRAQVSQTRAILPSYERDLAQVRHLIAVLAGRFPAEADALPHVALANLELPRELPVSLPSSLVRQRPDIRAAESLLHAANAQVGVATANLYPQIRLTASFGSEAVNAADLFAAGTGVWSAGAGLVQPIFRGGELRAKKRAAAAALDQARALYRQTVLQAFQNVADVLQALESDARTLAAQAEAASAARQAYEVTDRQFKLGGVSYLALLNAMRQDQQARIGLVQAQAARFVDTAALFQAVGGGWWSRDDGRETGSKERSVERRARSAGGDTP